VGLHRYHYDHHLHGHLRCYCCFVIFVVVVVGAGTVITEPPVQRISARALRRLHTGSPMTVSMYPSKGEWLCDGNRTVHSRDSVAVDLAITCIGLRLDNH
jgi:hypothetical protein